MHFTNIAVEAFKNVHVTISFFKVLDRGVIQLLSRLTQLHEAHYPETLREAVLVASSTICHMAVSLVRPFLAPRTRDKLQVVNEDGLRQYIQSKKWHAHRKFFSIERIYTSF